MTGPGPLALVVEDEPAMARLLASILGSAGYRTFVVATGRDALAQAATRAPDVVLVDLGLPDRDGIDVVRALRAWMRAPILVVSARGQEQDKVAALDAGADDYLTKPFGAGELLARLRVALRHAARGPSGDVATFAAGDLHVDVERREVRRGGTDVHLTPTEWKLLAVLVRHAGHVVLQRDLLREVWGKAAEAQGVGHYLRIYVAALRRKLEDEPAQPRWLVTEPGVGYRLRDEA
ncbi:MAG: response regulator [Planctomycetes bacterium]|nr:response regulator [Planctomycetota bacterium]